MKGKTQFPQLPLPVVLVAGDDVVVGEGVGLGLGVGAGFSTK